MAFVYLNNNQGIAELLPNIQLTWISSDIWQCKGIHWRLDTVHELSVSPVGGVGAARFHRGRGRPGIEILFNLTSGLMHQQFVISDSRNSSFHFAACRSSQQRENFIWNLPRIESSRFSHKGERGNFKNPQRQLQVKQHSCICFVCKAKNGLVILAPKKRCRPGCLRKKGCDKNTQPRHFVSSLIFLDE